MGKPAARIGDGHICPMVTPGTGTPHTGGPIIGPGCETVLIEGIPAATEGDVCACVGATDKITGGSTGVFIGGKPAARAGDKCEHGGLVIGGSGMVLIGESMGMNFLMLPCIWENNEKDSVQSKEEKVAIVKQAILECIALLENRLELLIRDDPKTLERFKKWFGCFDEESKLVIIKRMERQIAFFKDLALQSFDEIPYENLHRNFFAYVYSKDSSHTVFLGNPFWNDNLSKDYNKTTVLIHEVSHFKDIGGTIDYKYFDECDELAKVRPNLALKNADSYAFFVTGYK